MKTPRRRAREFIIQGLYQSELNPEISAQDIEKNLRENEYFAKADQALFAEVFYGALAHKKELYQMIIPHLDRPLEEVNYIEQMILLMASFELMTMQETPYPVIINEAIEVAKTFGGTDGYKFINGILDKLALDLRKAELKEK